MSATVFVINPNCLRSATAAIAQAMAPFENAGGLHFECVTFENGPPGIVTLRDAERVAPLVTDFVESHQTLAAGFIVACYSDPGVFASREIAKVPVIGIGAAGLEQAGEAGGRIGVIAISSKAVDRHWRSYRAWGLADRIVGERAIDLAVDESGDEALALSRLVQTGRDLRDMDGADVVVLGCAGMATLRDKVSQALGMPVIEPCAAAAEKLLGFYS
jgi:allantoin racemase